MLLDKIFKFLKGKKKPDLDFDTKARAAKEILKARRTDGRSSSLKLNR
jgi:hypothetical protein